MKILCTNPPWDGVRAGSRWPSKCEFRGYIPYPVFLAGGVSALRAAGHEVLFLDAIARRMRMCDVEPFYERVKLFAPDLIIQEISTASLPEDKAICERLSHLAPVALTGLHASTYAYQLQDQWPFVSSILQGEIERNAVELAKNIGDGWFNKVYPYDNAKSLDEYPMPAQENLYLYRDVPGPNGGVTYQMHASRGCPFRCAFCVEPVINTGRPSWRRKSAANIEAEVRSAYEKFPLLSGVYFDGPTENMRDNHCHEIADVMGKLKIPFGMMTRVDTIELETWDYMIDRGLYYVKAGVESANQKLVDDCGKQLDIPKVEQTVLHLKKRLPPRNIHLTCMYGLPGETYETVKETLGFLHKLGVHWQESYMAPAPGTGYGDESVYPVEELAMSGKIAPGNPDVAEWVKQAKLEYA